MKETPGAPLVVVSPHLDDAVLAAGRLLAAHPRSVVVTVFAGGKPDWSSVGAWDRACGFRPGDDVTATRRAEDRSALRELGAVPRWLDYPEQEYRATTPGHEDLVRGIAEALGDVPDRQVAVPLGLSHPDHVLTSDAALTTLQGLSVDRWLVYADFYHLARPDLVAPRVESLASRHGLSLRPVPAPTGDPSAKRRAIRRYRSQGRALGRRLDRWATTGPERLWMATRSYAPAPPV